MTEPIARGASYRGRSYSAEITEFCILRWISYRLSYRDLAAITTE
jgi:hypothetical protein